MLSLISAISRSLRPCIRRSWVRAPLLLGHAPFSSTQPTAITRAQREQESEESRAARLAHRHQNAKDRLANETDEARAARLARYCQHYKDLLANETDEAREARLARKRERYTENREHIAARQRKTKRESDVRERIKAYMKQYRRDHSPEQPKHKNLGDRRSDRLLQRVFSTWRTTETWTWKTHKPVSYHDRIDHRCTACGKLRFLKYWWKEKPCDKATDTSSDQDRYMCNHCFANDWNLVVPEKYSGKLPLLFTSPDHPLPSMRLRSKEEVKEESQSD